jgi:hypothetical protein
MQGCTFLFGCNCKQNFDPADYILYINCRAMCSVRCPLFELTAQLVAAHQLLIYAQSSTILYEDLRSFT